MGIASCFSYYTHKKAVNFAAEPLLRDLSVYIFTLLYLFAIFWDLKITFWEAVLLMCFLPVYLGYIYLKGGSPAFIGNIDAAQQPVMM
jgi:Ca2+/Na+ antiporter